MKLTKAEVLEETRKLLEAFPNDIRCVACGLTEPVTWMVQDDREEDALALTISLSAGTYKDWCVYSEDPKRGLKSGDHCPACHQTRRKA